MKLIAIYRSDGGVSMMRIMHDDADIAVLVRQWEEANVTRFTADSYREVTEEVDASEPMAQLCRSLSEARNEAAR